MTWKTFLDRIHAALFLYMARIGGLASMTSATDTLLAGAPTPAPAPPSGAPAPAPEPGGAPAPSPSPSPSPAPAPVAADPWAGLDDESKAFIEAKGFKSPADALAALRESQAPDTPDAYQLPVPDGQDPAFSKTAAGWFHEAGLSPKQAQAVAAKWNEHVAATAQQAKDAEAVALRDAAAKAEREDADLKREWGDKYDANGEHGRRAVAQFVPGDQATKAAAMQALEGVLGYGAMMKMFAGIGALIAEDTAHGLGGAVPATAATASRIYDKSNMNP